MDEKEDDTKGDGSDGAHIEGMLKVEWRVDAEGHTQESTYAFFYGPDTLSLLYTTPMSSLQPASLELKPSLPLF